MYNKKEIDLIDPSKCPDCKRQMTWSQVNQQWYCEKCEIFHLPGPAARKTTSDHINEELDDFFGSKPKQQLYYCPECSTPLNWIPQYSRWFCYTCQRYV